MAKVFKTHVAVHKDPATSVWFAPGDEVPAWAEDLVGDHVFEENDEEDVRLTDPENEEDDDATKWSTVNDLPPETADLAASEDVADDGEESDAEEVDLNTLKKAELVELAEERGLATSGNKEELIARIQADLDEEEE